jgi:ribosomal protein L20
LLRKQNSIERWWWCAVVYKYRDSFGITMSVNASINRKMLAQVAVSNPNNLYTISNKIKIIN